jgi:hypothetical protein
MAVALKILTVGLSGEAGTIRDICRLQIFACPRRHLHNERLFRWEEGLEGGRCIYASIFRSVHTQCIALAHDKSRDNISDGCDWQVLLKHGK